jgi:hypothetical protein
MSEVIDGQIVSISDGHFPQSYAGLAASKPINPGMGDQYLETDTGKEYACFAANIWSLQTSPSYIQYSNQTGAIDSVLGENCTGLGTVLQDSSIHSFILSSGAGTGRGQIQSPALVVPAVHCFEFNFVVGNIIYGNGTPTGFVFGLVSLYPHMSICIAWNSMSNVWICYSESGASETTIIANIVDGDHIMIKNFGSVIMFFVNGVLVATHSGVLGFGLLLPFLANAESVAPATIPSSIGIEYFAWKVFS